MLKVCDWCKDGLDVGHPLAQNGVALAPFRADGAHPSIHVCYIASMNYCSVCVL